MARVLRRRARRDQGVVIVFVAVALAVIFTFAALSIDTAQHVNDRQLTSDTLDVAAHTGAQLLDEGVTRDHLDQQIRASARANDPSQTFGSDQLAIEYLCVVALGAEDSLQSPPNTTGVCSGDTTTARVAGGYYYLTCDPDVHQCNAVRVMAGKDVPYRFAPVIGQEQGTTGSLVSTACKGSCAAVPQQYMDIGFVIDRTISMSRAEVQAIADVLTGESGMLGGLDEDFHRVAIATIHRAAGGAGGGSSRCTSAGNDGTWLPVEITDEFVGTASLAQSCVQRLPASLSSQLYPTTHQLGGRGHTDYQGPLDAVRAALTAAGSRGGADTAKVIIFLTDGKPNLPADQPCRRGADAAVGAKNAGIKVVTIAYRLSSGEQCTSGDHSDFRGM